MERILNSPPASDMISRLFNLPQNSRFVIYEGGPTLKTTTPFGEKAFALTFENMRDLSIKIMDNINVPSFVLNSIYGEQNVTRIISDTNLPNNLAAMTELAWLPGSGFLVKPFGSAITDQISFRTVNEIARNKRPDPGHPHHASLLFRSNRFFSPFQQST
jgi:hypothetical protein